MLIVVVVTVVAVPAVNTTPFASAVLPVASVCYCKVQLWIQFRPTGSPTLMNHEEAWHCTFLGFMLRCSGSLLLDKYCETFVLAKSMLKPGILLRAFLSTGDHRRDRHQYDQIVNKHFCYGCYDSCCCCDGYDDDDYYDYHDSYYSCCYCLFRLLLLFRSVNEIRVVFFCCLYCHYCLLPLLLLSLWNTHTATACDPNHCARVLLAPCFSLPQHPPAHTKKTRSPTVNDSQCCDPGWAAENLTPV